MSNKTLPSRKLEARRREFDAMHSSGGDSKGKEGKTIYNNDRGKMWAFHRPGSNK